MGMRILEALTREQVTHLLDTVLRIYGNQGREKLLGALDDDVASTLTRLLHPGAASGKRIVSDDRQLQEWTEHWRHWSRIVSELGDENGRYAVRDRDWDAPRFAAEDLAADLEQVAEQMLPMLESVYETGNEGDELFEGALVDMENDISAYPEWMGADEDSCTLGPQTTQCVLRWGRLGTGSAADLVSRVAELQAGLKTVTLSSQATIDFFRSLPREDCREVYAVLHARRKDPEWQEDLESTGSHWHQIYYGFRKTCDPDGYVEDCKRLLHQDWRYGFPVIEHAASAGHTAEAERTARETMGSMLKTEWAPEETLLLSVLNRRFFFRFSKEDVIKLLEQWTSLAEQLGKQERAAALRFQQRSWQDSSDWSGIAECYHSLMRLSFSQTAEKLVTQWKKDALGAQLRWSVDRRGVTEDCWVMWLLDEAMSEAPDGERFLAKADQ
jgi:hypothetical protein